jgi:hypothetical protein
VAVAGVLIVAVVIYNFRVEPTAEMPANAALGEEWLLFDQPRSDTLIGAAWDTQLDAPRWECYKVVNRMQSESFRSKAYTWTGTQEDSAAVAFGRLIGAGIRAGRRDQGVVRFDSLVVLQADVVPDPSKCRSLLGTYPRLPAVVALIGARGYRLIRRRGTEAGASIDSSTIHRQVRAAGGHIARRGDSVEVNFDSMRWLGYRLQGWEVAGGSDVRSDTGSVAWRSPTYMETVALNAEHELRFLRYRISVLPEDSPKRFRIVYWPKRLAGGSTQDTVMADFGESIALQPASLGAPPEGYLEIYLDRGPTDSVRLGWHVVGSTPCVFSQESDRRFAREFALRRFQTPGTCGRPPADTATSIRPGEPPL